MKRSLVLAILILGPVLAAPDIGETADAFAAEYKIWSHTRNTSIRGALSATEVLAWQRVKHAFRQLEKQTDAEYRGDLR